LSRGGWDGFKLRGMSLKEKPSLIECLHVLPDPRVTGRCDHKLVDLLVIALCTLLCGGESFPDMRRFALAKWDWLKGFLELPAGVPSHDTFNRLFQALDPKRFLEVFAAWTQGLRRSISEEIVAVDGKALRRAKGRGQSACAVVSAWARDNGLALGQVKVADQSNEITAIPELLRALETERLYRDDRCPGLPEEHCPGDPRGRRPVCAGAQRQSGHRLCRDSELFG